MLDLPPPVAAACVAAWERLTAQAHADLCVTLRPVDRLAVAALARHLCLGEGYAQALAASGNPPGLSASTLSRRLTEWEVLGCLEPLTALASGEDWQAALQRAMAGRSYPWYCQHLREQAGLLLDDELLRRMARGERDPEPALLRVLGLEPGPMDLVRRRAEQVRQALGELHDDLPVLMLAAPPGSSMAAILAAVAELRPFLFAAAHTWRPPAAAAEHLCEWFAHAIAPAGGAISPAALLHDSELRRRLLTRSPALLLIEGGVSPDIPRTLLDMLVGTSSRAIVVTTADALATQGWSGPRLDARLVTPPETVALLREVLGYRGRLPSGLGNLELAFWGACGGHLGEALALAEQVRWWIRTACSANVALRHLGAYDLLFRAWQAVEQASQARGAAAGAEATSTTAWQALSAEQRVLLQACAALPARPWDTKQLALLAGAPPEALNLPPLVLGGWLVPSGKFCDEQFVYPNWTRRASGEHTVPLPELLAAFIRLWSGQFAPLLRAQQSYHDVLAEYEAEVNDILIEAMLTAVEAAGDRADCLPLAATLLRLLWRHLSDILQPSGRTRLHLRLVRLADDLFDALPRSVALPTDTAEWADLAAEHALIAGERCFLCWSVQEHAEAQAALEHAESLLPTLADIFTSAGGRRQCLLTAYANLIAYGVLLVRDEQRRGVLSPEAAIRRLLGLLQRHAAFEQAETADEQRKQLPRSRRRNYPAWWEAGRTLARYHYWRSLCWLGLVDLARTVAPAQLEAWGEQARQTADAAYHEYLQGTRQNHRDRARAWHALLLQGEVARATGQPVAAPPFAEAAARAAASDHRPDLAAIFWIESAHLWQRSAAQNWQQPAERALLAAWQAARTQDAATQTLVLYRAEQLLGRPWQPRSSSRHRTRRRASGSDALDDAVLGPGHS